MTLAYILQTVKFDDVGTITNRDITFSKSKAERWYNKKDGKTISYGYQVVDV